MKCMKEFTHEGLTGYGNCDLEFGHDGLHKTTIDVTWNDEVK